MLHLYDELNTIICLKIGLKGIIFLDIFSQPGDVDKNEIKKPLERLRRRLEDNIKMDIQKLRCGRGLD
jgi:hypothetical protein